MASLIEIRKERLRKLKELRQLGIDPYPSISGRSHLSKEVLDRFTEFEGKEVTLAGRLVAWRDHGPVCFGDLEDESGRIQILIRKDKLEASERSKSHLGYGQLALLDLADFVEARGAVIKTKTGQISLEVKWLRLLAKSLRPLPEKHDGLKDPELIFRQRYLDLATNPKRRELFKRKTLFWDVQRDFLKAHGFVEIQTPVLELTTGGADARPFITHHNALDQDYYLRISLELPLKRLIGGGYEKVFGIGPVFRNEGIDDEHLQEYLMLEWYWAYADYKMNMRLVRDEIRQVSDKLYGKSKFERGGHSFDLSRDWPEIDYLEALKNHYGLEVMVATQKELLKAVQKSNIEFSGLENRRNLTDALWKNLRKQFSGPAFVVNEPKFMSPLAKSNPDKPELTERFHVILGGSEVGNGYSELNDPVDQLERFKEQQAIREQGDDEAQMLDLDFVEMLEHGMPPVSGYGHSERLFFFLENLPAREATLFPQLRHKTTDLQRQIYGL